LKHNKSSQVINLLVNLDKSHYLHNKGADVGLPCTKVKANMRLPVSELW